MDDQRGVGQLLHQAARTAGMIQVDVRHDNVADFLGSPPAVGEDRQDAPGAVVVAGLDDSHRGIGLEQVAGGHLRPDLAAVDRHDAVFVFQYCDAFVHYLFLVWFARPDADPARQGRTASGVGQVPTACHMIGVVPVVIKPAGTFDMFLSIEVPS
jgi:hypothetical protein